MASADEVAECGFCLEQGDRLVDPRALPCNHLHCYPCLVGDFDTNRIVRCGKCKEVFDLTLTRLPPAATEGNGPQLCDICIDKGTEVGPAVSFCSPCGRKMCTKHDQIHQDFHPKHKEVMNMKEFKQNQTRLEVKGCSRHVDSPITMGCITCLELLCINCMGSSQLCADGSSHRGVTLDELVRDLKRKAMEVKVETQAKEEKLTALLKECTRELSDYESNTAEMIELLHNTRDEQLAEIRAKYDRLEEEITQSRRRRRNGMLEFMEREIGDKLTEMNTLLLLQDARFRDAHQVDVVSNFTEVVDELRSFIDEKLPSLTFADSTKLKALGRWKDIKLEMVKESAIPTSLRLQQEVELDQSCYSVCSHQGVTYMACKGGTAYEVDQSWYSLSQPLSLGSGTNINGMCAYGGRLYLLVHPWTVQVHKLDGRFIYSWKHSDSSGNINKLAVTADRVVVPDISNKRLTVYSLEGQLIKQISCKQDGDWGVTGICIADKKSVVVSNHSVVFRVNIDTGDVMWTSTCVTQPVGVTCYGSDYVLVTSRSTTQTEIYVLDIETGGWVVKLVDPKKRQNSYVCDLCVTGNTLIVPRREENAVLYYQLVDE